MQVKLLSGEVIELPDEEPELAYLTHFVPKERQPWTRVSLFEADGQRCLVVNTYSLLPRVEAELAKLEEWPGLNFNPAPSAIEFLLRHPEKILWREFSMNRGAIHVLKENLDKVDWLRLSCNPAAEELFRMFPDKVYWHSVAVFHPNARELLEEFSRHVNSEVYARTLLEEFSRQEKFDVVASKNLFINKHIRPEWVEDLVDFSGDRWPLPTMTLTRPAMMPLIERYFPAMTKGKVELFTLSHNPAAIDFLKRHPEWISQDGLRWNTNPEAAQLLAHNELKSIHPAAVEFLRLHPENIEPDELLGNPRAIDLIREYHLDITDWGELLKNEAAGELIVEYIDRIPITQELLMLECIALK